METLNVFNIQRYSLHDGEGIRTLIFLKGCPLRCPWCANPESQRVENEIMYDAKACIGCQRCREVCPANYETFAGRICPDCEKCVEECYTGALQKVSKVCCLCTSWPSGFTYLTSFRKAVICFPFRHYYKCEILFCKKSKKNAEELPVKNRNPSAFCFINFFGP